MTSADDPVDLSPEICEGPVDVSRLLQHGSHHKAREGVGYFGPVRRVVERGNEWRDFGDDLRRTLTAKVIVGAVEALVRPRRRVRGEEVGHVKGPERSFDRQVRSEERRV